MMVKLVNQQLSLLSANDILRCAQSEKGIYEAELIIMDKRLVLHVPTMDELWYREKIMSDPATMAYNAGYDMGFDEYHNDTGCIDFPEADRKDWYKYFVGNEPECFYAYLMRIEDNTFIGEVNVHSENNDGIYEMGIVIEAGYRGCGYSTEGLHLLLEHTFEKMNAVKVCNSFETDRTAALKAHLAVGFEKRTEKGGIIEVEITRKMWELYQ